LPEAANIKKGSYLKFWAPLDEIIFSKKESVYERHNSRRLGANSHEPFPHAGVHCILKINAQAEAATAEMLLKNAREIAALADSSSGSIIDIFV